MIDDALILADAPIVDARRVQVNPDGSMVFEVPITVETPTVDWSRTSGGGATKGKLLVSDLVEMAQSLTDYGKPMSVGFSDPMSGGHDRSIEGPQEAWIESARVVGDTLWGTIKSNAFRSQQLMADAWRAFSIEAAKNFTNATGTFKDWVLQGGTFTNNPAFKVHFRIAASDGSGADHRLMIVNFRLSPDTPKETDMSKLLIALGAKTEDEAVIALTAKDGEIADLKAKLADSAKKAPTTATAGDPAEVINLQTALAETQAKTATALGQIETLSATLRDLKSERAGEKVRLVIANAINDGHGNSVADPAEFDLGPDKPKWNDDPAAWLKASAYDSSDQLEAILTKRVSRKTGASSVSSGAAGSTPATKLALTEKQAEAIKAAGLTVEQLEAAQ
jgi:hypothetical protein